MAKVTYIEHNGTEHTIDVPEGVSLMAAAVNNVVPGIDAECGGACACATCMVYVPPEWLDKLPPKETGEAGMLEYSAAAKENSRLSCQIKMTQALDGIIVTMPESQH